MSKTKTCPTNPDEICINVDAPQPDPSGGRGEARAVDITPEYFDIKRPGGQNGTRLTFKLSGQGVRKITGIRYMNASTRYAGEWYLPGGSPASWNYRDPPWPIASDPGWQNLEIVDDTTVSVDFPRRNAVYRYVVEWEDVHNVTHVCDPMIRNEG